MTIFIAKLNFKTVSMSLKEAFEQFGTVLSANVITDKETGRSKGYGFVEMPNEDEGNEAINALDGSDFDGSTIAVKKATPRENSNNGNDKKNTGGFGGGGRRW